MRSVDVGFTTAQRRDTLGPVTDRAAAAPKELRMPFRSARLRIVGSTWERLLWVASAGFALLVVFVCPLVSSFGMSLETWNLISNIRRWAGASNYITVMLNPALPEILRVTALYTGLSVVLEGASASVWRRWFARDCGAGCPASRSCAF